MIDQLKKEQFEVAQKSKNFPRETLIILVSAPAFNSYEMYRMVVVEGVEKWEPRDVYMMGNSMFLGGTALRLSSLWMV